MTRGQSYDNSGTKPSIKKKVNLRFIQSALQNEEIESAEIDQQYSRSYDDEQQLSNENQIVLGLNRIELYSPIDD